MLIIFWPTINSKKVNFTIHGLNSVLFCLLKGGSYFKNNEELMKNVVCLIEEVLMIFLLKNPVICILDWFKLLLNPLPEKVLMLLCLCV